MGLDISHYIPSTEIELEYFTKEQLGNSIFVERYKHLFRYHETLDEHLLVLYVKEKGYQRKGMNRSFYNDFENNKPYFDIHSVIKASGYLEAAKGESINELRLHFKQNFIDNFVEGESIFTADW